MADENVIQCPTCGKRFKLPARPPATFACTQCATVMDLSGFRTEEAPVAASRSGGAGSSVGRAAGGGAKRTTGGAAAARARRARAAQDEGDEEEGGRRGLPPEKKSNTLLWASFGGFVLAIFLVMMLMNKKKVDDVTKKPSAEPVASATDEPETPGTPAMAGTGPVPPSTGTVGTVPGTGAPGSDGTAGMEGTSPAAPSGPYVASSKLTFAPVPHHPDATAEDKARIDELIQKAIFESAGRDSRDAGHELVDKFGMKAAPRLINVFATVSLGEGFGDIQGRMKCGVTDSLLRRIDGYIERKKSPRNTPVKATSDAKWVEKIARYWTAWWLNGEWQTPNKPWNDRVDGNREDAADAPAAGGPAPAMGGGVPDGGEGK